jgi:hypothetical protein
MCSIICWILSIWEALGCNFCIVGLIHALSTRGRSLSLFWATECILKVFKWFWAISGLCVSPVWPVVVTGLTGQSAGPVHMLRTDLTGGGDCLTGQSWADPATLFLSSGLNALVQGELFVVFELWFCGLRSLLEHTFVSNVSSRFPCLRGPRLVFFKWSCSLPFFGFRSLVGVSF